MGGGLEPPVEVLLSWRPNYVNPVTRGPEMIILEAVLLGLCYILVGLRVWTRATRSRNFGLDDVVIIINMIPLTGLAITLFLGYTKYGWNRHVWDSTIPTLIKGRKAILIYENLYTLSTATTKISVLLFYRRLTARSLSKYFQWAIYAAMSSVIMFALVFTILNWTACTPLAAEWNIIDPAWRVLNEGEYQCVNEGSIIIASAAISSIQDVAACAMPMALFWQRKISKRQKIALTVIFSVGYLLCICAVLRIYFVVRIYYFTYDLTWEAHNVWYTTTIESHLAVICASAPALQHYFKTALQNSSLGSRLRSLTSNRKSYINTTSNTGSALAQKRKTNVQLKIHLVQDVRLEEYNLDSPQPTPTPLSSDRLAAPWLDEEKYPIPKSP